MQFGYEWAFVAKACSFFFSAFAIWKLRAPDADGFRADRREALQRSTRGGHMFSDFTDSLAYMRCTPLVFAIALAGVGWATGGGAAQILFTLFGQQVYHRGPAGVGLIWGFAGVGLVLGGVLGHSLGRRLSYPRYLHAIWIGFLVHGLAYVLFSLGDLLNAVVFITLSRVAMGANNVQNRTMLLKHVPDVMRGRIYTTVEAMSNATMMISLTVASIATRHYDPRSIAFVAGLFSTATAIPWAWATFARKLPEPAVEPVLLEPESFEERRT
jgi:MFS family permease